MDKAAPPGEIVYGRIESGLCRLRPSDDLSKAEKILANGALPESLTSGTAPAVPGGGASLSEVARFHLKLGIRPGFERRFLRMSFEKRFPAFARGPQSVARISASEFLTAATAILSLKVRGF